MAQELNLIEKSPSYHNPYVYKEDQQVYNGEFLSSFLSFDFYRKNHLYPWKNLKNKCKRKKQKKKSRKNEVIQRIFSHMIHSFIHYYMLYIGPGLSGSRMEL